jgi:hypothetical protein
MRNRHENYATRFWEATFQPGDENQKISKKPEKPFSVDRRSAAPPEGASLTEKAQQAHFPGVTAQFSKADLRNPQKVETVLRTSVEELIQTEFPQARFSRGSSQEFCRADDQRSAFPKQAPGTFGEAAG